MALPRQVEKQLKELEELEKQLSAVPEAQDTEETPVEGVEDAVESEPIEQEAEPEAKKEPEAEAKPEPEQAKKSDDDVHVWKQKYKTLQGMYDAEVPRLHGQVKELNAQLEKLQVKFDKQLEATKKAEEVARLVTDDDVQTFGEDLIEVQRKVAREVAGEFEAKLAKLQQENEELREQVTSTSSKIAESSFEQRLHRLVPDFEQVNASPEWISWLNEVDPLLRGPRMTIAQQAYEAGDAEAVAHYVRLFKETQVVEDAAPKASTKEVERQIQPTRSASSTAAPTGKGRIYSPADMEVLFSKMINASNRGRIDEARQLEAEIDTIYKEGRVR